MISLLQPFLRTTSPLQGQFPISSVHRVCQDGQHSAKRVPEKRDAPTRQGLSASLHTLAAARGLDPTAAVDIHIEAISAEVHGLGTLRPGFPDNIGAGCS